MAFYLLKAASMENKLYLLSDAKVIDSGELIIRFIYHCKSFSEKNTNETPLLSFVDIVTAVYYYRKYPNVDDFISKYLKHNKDYFFLQWVRSTWATLSKMTEEEMSNLVINQIAIVASLIEEE